MRRLALCVALLLGGTAVPTRAQDNGCDPLDPFRRCTPGWVGHFATLSGNALLGGLAAGVRRELTGGAFARGFVQGALGGVGVYLGKRLAAERFDGAGFLGREVAAVGSSIVWNASEGRPPLERLMLPAGPLPLHLVIDNAAGRVHPVVDVQTLGWLSYGLIESRFRLAVGESLSSGAPVFDAPGYTVVVFGDTVGGFAANGVVFTSDQRRLGGDATTVAHERIHVLQGDFVRIVWSRPLDSWILRSLPVGRLIRTHVSLDAAWLPVALVRVVAGGAPGSTWTDSPWELEADFLARTP